MDFRVGQSRAGREELETASINKYLKKLVEVEERIQLLLVGSSVYFKTEDEECLSSD